MPKLGPAADTDETQRKPNRGFLFKKVDNRRTDQGTYESLPE